MAGDASNPFPGPRKHCPCVVTPSKLPAGSPAGSRAQGQNGPICRVPTRCDHIVSPSRCLNVLVGLPDYAPWGRFRYNYMAWANKLLGLEKTNMYALTSFLFYAVQIALHLAVPLAFVFGIPTLTGFYSWHHYKSRPIMSTIGWIFTALWLTGIVIVVGFAIALIVNPPQFPG